MSAGRVVRYGAEQVIGTFQINNTVLTSGVAAFTGLSIGAGASSVTPVSNITYIRIGEIVTFGCQFLVFFTGGAGNFTFDAPVVPSGPVGTSSGLVTTFDGTTVSWNVSFAGTTKPVVAWKNLGDTGILHTINVSCMYQMV